MTNREWLNTLSDKEFARTIFNLCDECDLCPKTDKSSTCATGDCHEQRVNWLFQPHEIYRAKQSSRNNQGK